MPKKKKDNGAGGAFFFIKAIVITLLLLVALVTPFLFLIGALIKSLQTLKINKLSGTTSDFWLTDPEKSVFLQKVDAMKALQKELQNANQRGIDKGLTRNKDGAFSARSNLGKEIQKIIAEKKPVYESLVEQIQAIQTHPILKWEKLNNDLKKGKAYIWALLSWATTMIGTFIFFNGYNSKRTLLENTYEAFQPYWSLLTHLFRDGNLVVEGTNDYTILAISTSLAILGYFVSLLIHNNALEQFTPRPPKVTPSNLHDY